VHALEQVSFAKEVSGYHHSSIRLHQDKTKIWLEGLKKGELLCSKEEKLLYGAAHGVFSRVHRMKDEGVATDGQCDLETGGGGEGARWGHVCSAYQASKEDDEKSNKTHIETINTEVNTTLFQRGHIDFGFKSLEKKTKRELFFAKLWVAFLMLKILSALLIINILYFFLLDKSWSYSAELSFPAAVH
jgi:hypothetical protein